MTVKNISGEFRRNCEKLLKKFRKNSVQTLEEFVWQFLKNFDKISKIVNKLRYVVRFSKKMIK